MQIRVNAHKILNPQYSSWFEELRSGAEEMEIIHNILILSTYCTFNTCECGPCISPCSHILISNRMQSTHMHSVPVCGHAYTLTMPNNYTFHGWFGCRCTTNSSMPSSNDDLFKIITKSYLSFINNQTNQLFISQCIEMRWCSRI